MGERWFMGGRESANFLCPRDWMYSHTWKLARSAMPQPSRTRTGWDSAQLTGTSIPPSASLHLYVLKEWVCPCQSHGCLKIVSWGSNKKEKRRIHCAVAKTPGLKKEKFQRGSWLGHKILMARGHILPCRKGLNAHGWADATAVTCSQL